MGCFSMAGILPSFVAGVAAFFETSNSIHGGETNDLAATATLFVSIFSLFTGWLHLLGFVNSNE